MAEYTVVSEDSSVYYGHTYWNDIEVVRRELNRRVSGDLDRDWVDHFQATVGSRRFERALMLNCGNGHVERSLLVRGLVAETVGIDCSAELLDEATRAAAGEGLPARYVQLDVNTADFPPGPYDLVVNFSAAHHVQRVDRVLRKACSMLTDDGCLVAYDYVGPHRNQYPWVMWEAAYQANQALPDHLRQDMSYPHLPTMLAHDPTEAIHPELVMDVMRRYFVVEEFAPLGGAIGYLLLTHNRRLFAADPAEREKWADEIMALDAQHLAAHPEHTLFAYWLARPDKQVLNRHDELLEWEAEEEERERAAYERGGEYYPRTSLQTLAIDLEDQRQRARLADDLHAELEAHRAQLSALEGSPGVRVWSRLGRSRAAGWVRERPKLASAVRRLLPR